MFLQNEKEITWDDLSEMGGQVIGRFIEMYSDSRGQIIKFLHTPTMIEFKLAWVQNWNYSEEGSCGWGKKDYIDTGYELKIPRDKNKSITIFSGGGIRILQSDKGCEYFFDIRGDISPISAIVSSEILPFFKK